MIISALAWFTVVGIPLLILVGLGWLFYRKVTRELAEDDAPAPLHDLRYSYTAPPPDYVEPTVTMTTTKDMPDWTSIDEESFMTEEEPVVDCRKIVDAGTRVWRIYRSVDRIHWAECDPALTEHAACNYADYIKRSNPEEFVRCDDPNGVILFYE